MLLPLLWIWIIAGCGAALVIAVLLIMRPAFVLQFVMRTASRTSAVDDLLDLMSRTTPYAWLLSGHTWSTVQREAGEHPEMFPRLLTAYRVLGTLTLGVAGLVIAVVVSMAFREAG